MNKEVPENHVNGYGNEKHGRDNVIYERENDDVAQRCAYTCLKCQCFIISSIFMGISVILLIIALCLMIPYDRAEVDAYHTALESFLKESPHDNNESQFHRMEDTGFCRSFQNNQFSTTEINGKVIDNQDVDLDYVEFNNITQQKCKTHCVSDEKCVGYNFPQNVNSGQYGNCIIYKYTDIRCGVFTTTSMANSYREGRNYACHCRLDHKKECIGIQNLCYSKAGKKFAAFILSMISLGFTFFAILWHCLFICHQKGIITIRSRGF